MKDDLAAPASGLPFLPTALVSQLAAAEPFPLFSASHFFIKEFLAAPASGLPFLSTAFDAQVVPFAEAAGLVDRGAPAAAGEDVGAGACACAKATPAVNTKLTAARISFFIATSLQG